MAFVSARVVFLVLNLAEVTWGHGRLREPPSRSSMWREGYKTPVNYEDNQLFCGGFEVQWDRYNGACGVCGDPWDGERQNEAGGKYAKGIIVRHYQQGQVINVSVEVTAHHMGWFEFRLCPHDDPTTPVSHDCLNRHLLHLPDVGGNRFQLPPNPRGLDVYNIRVLLPRDVTCSQCVLQWKYNTGNSWGEDPITQEGCIGCGPQEQFFGCSDVAILPGDVTRHSTETKGKNEDSGNSDHISPQHSLGGTELSENVDTVTDKNIIVVEDTTSNFVTSSMTSGAAGKSNVLTTVIITSAKTLGSAFPSSTENMLRSPVKTISPSMKKPESVNTISTSSRRQTGTGSTTGSLLKQLITSSMKRHLVKTTTPITQEYRRIQNEQLTSPTTTVTPLSQATAAPSLESATAYTKSQALHGENKPSLVHNKPTPTLTTVMTTTSSPRKTHSRQISPIRQSTTTIASTVYKSDFTSSSTLSSTTSQTHTDSLSSGDAESPSSELDTTSSPPRSKSPGKSANTFESPRSSQSVSRSPEPSCASYVPTATHSDTPGMADWCLFNCPSSNCLSSYCACVPMTTISGRCRPTPAYKSMPGYEWWCSTQCQGSECPRDVCDCE